MIPAWMYRRPPHPSFSLPTPCHPRLWPLRTLPTPHTLAPPCPQHLPHPLSPSPVLARTAAVRPCSDRNARVPRRLLWHNPCLPPSWRLLHTTTLPLPISLCAPCSVPRLAVAASDVSAHLQLQRADAGRRDGLYNVLGWVGFGRGAWCVGLGWHQPQAAVHAHDTGTTGTAAGAAMVVRVVVVVVAAAAPVSATGMPAGSAATSALLRRASVPMPAIWGAQHRRSLSVNVCGRRGGTGGLPNVEAARTAQRQPGSAAARSAARAQTHRKLGRRLHLATQDLSGGRARQRDRGPLRGQAYWCPTAALVSRGRPSWLPGCPAEPRLQCQQRCRAPRAAWASHAVTLTLIPSEEVRRSCGVMCLRKN